MIWTAIRRSATHSRAASGLGAAVTAALLLFAGPAGAAPQGLGLVATAQPVPMRCTAEGCAAQLSSFCLQRARKSPNHGTPYHVAGGAGLWLHLVAADGTRRRVPAGDRVRLVSSRGNTGIEVRLKVADPAELGAVTIAVEVGPLVTILPDPVPGDAAPITPEEARFAAGPARLLAADYFDSPAALGESLNILDRAINALGPDTRLGDAERRALWHRITATAPAAGAEPAERVFATCLDELRRGLVYGLRNCLAGRRDELLIRTNTELWKALEPGS
ncbi:MAG: hypothetical protein JSU82_17725 [Rhodospirillales bacterium]|nr:MAG: hypothetical protein JSU82_17725 [Rhodospirillales bacterium]